VSQSAILQDSFRNVVSFYHQIRAFFELVKKQLGGTFRVHERSANDPHFMYDATHDLAHPETWLTSHFTMIMVPENEQDDRTPDKVLFFTIYSNCLDSGLAFSIVGGFLDRDFLGRYLVKEKGSAKPYWDYLKIFKECKPEGGELKNTRKGVSTPVESISIFSSKAEVEAFVRLVAGKFQDSISPEGS